MKRSLKFIMSASAVAAAALLSTSCSTEKSSPEDEIPSEKVSLTVHVKSSNLDTKSTTITAENEAEVNKLQVLVFSSNGTLETYGMIENKDTLTLECLSGDKTIFAIVNGPDLDYIKYLDDLMENPSYLSDNYTNSFVMWGSKEERLSKNSEISIKISRIVSKITLSKISRDMSNTPAFKDSDLSIESIYLVNAPGNYFLSGDVPSLWCNPSFNNYACKDFLYDRVKTPLLEGESYNIDHTFYVYPNPTEVDSDSKTWCSRRTRIVVEVLLDQKTYFYPVTLPVIESNKSYNITDIRITRPGTTSPDLIVTKSEVDADLSISEWTEALTTSASI